MLKVGTKILVHYTGATDDQTEEIELTSQRLHLTPVFLVEGSDVEVRVKEKEGKWFEDTVVKNLD